VVPEQIGGPGAVAAAAGGPTGTASGPISAGSATLEQLDTIEGIGPVTAQKIVDYRAQHGGISSVDQLDEIDGIGPATMDALRARLQP
jgi:competence protein ComEA